MDSGIKRFAFAAFLLLFVVSAVLVTSLPQPVVEGGVSQLLTDGSVVRVEAVTAGTRHEYRTGPAWLEKLQQNVPRALRGWLGSEVRSMRHTTAVEGVMPWLSITATGGGSPQWEQLHVVAESGEVFEVNSRSFPGGLPDRRFMLPRIDVMPRRDPFFTLTGIVNRLPFSLRMANPLSGRTHPTWTPTPIPVTNRVGGFDVELAEAELYRTSMGERLSARYKAYEDGRFLDGWFDYSWRLTDATGNNGYLLPTNEPAWRIELSLRRTFAARWSTNDYREFPLTNLPAAGELREFTISGPIGGVPIPLVWIAGPGEYVMENGVFTTARPPAPGGGDSWSSSSGGTGDWKIHVKRKKPWIMIQRQAQQPDYAVAAFLFDSENGNIEVRRRGSSGSGVFYAEHFEVRPPANMPPGPLRLRVAGERTLHTEFTIDPARIQRVDRRPRK